MAWMYSQRGIVVGNMDSCVGDRLCSEEPEPSPQLQETIDPVSCVHTHCLITDTTSLRLTHLLHICQGIPFRREQLQPDGSHKLLPSSALSSVEALLQYRRPNPPFQAFVAEVEVGRPCSNHTTLDASITPMPVFPQHKHAMSKPQ
jgi:hypothetical protein